MEYTETRKQSEYNKTKAIKPDKREFVIIQSLIGYFLLTLLQN